MRTSCFNCHKKIIIGHDLYYGLSIDLKDIISHHNIWFHESGLEQAVSFCEGCGDVAEQIAKELCKFLASKVKPIGG